MLYDIWRSRLIFLTVSVFFLLFAIWISPERLIPLGIMDFSLTSENELTRRTAQLEITLAKYGGFALAVICMGFFFAMPTLQRSSKYQAFMERDLYYPKPYEDGLKRIYDWAFALILGLLVLSFAYFLFAKSVFPPEIRGMIHREDGVIEYTSAVLLILAAGYAGYTGLFATTIRRAPRFFHLFLAFLFFAMCGEEISWGQRIFGFGTPEAFSNLNVQNEVNLHNMFGYLFDHLFILLFFLWGCIVPLLFHLSQTVRQIIRWVGLPLPSVGLALGMLLITLYQDKIVFLVFDKVPGLRIPEVRELLSAAAFFALMRQSQIGLIAR